MQQRLVYNNLVLFTAIMLSKTPKKASLLKGTLAKLFCFALTVKTTVAVDTRAHHRTKQAVKASSLHTIIHIFT